MKIQRYRLKYAQVLQVVEEYGGVMVRDPAGAWMRVEDVDEFIQKYTDDLCLGWNAQLKSGGALNHDESKV